jgi:hypothetical protein
MFSFTYLKVFAVIAITYIAINWGFPNFVT